MLWKSYGTHRNRVIANPMQTDGLDIPILTFAILLFKMTPQETATPNVKCLRQSTSVVKYAARKEQSDDGRTNCNAKQGSHRPQTPPPMLPPGE